MLKDTQTKHNQVVYANTVQQLFIVIPRKLTNQTEMLKDTSEIGQSSFFFISYFVCGFISVTPLPFPHSETKELSTKCTSAAVKICPNPIFRSSINEFPYTGVQIITKYAIYSGNLRRLMKILCTVVGRV